MEERFNDALEVIAEMEGKLGQAEEEQEKLQESLKAMEAKYAAQDAVSFHFLFLKKMKSYQPLFNMSVSVSYSLFRKSKNSSSLCKKKTSKLQNSKRAVLPPRTYSMCRE
jgi:hypothetical protein